MLVIGLSSLHFDSAYYCDRYPDVRASGLDPRQHFDRYGWREGRSANANFSASEYLFLNNDVKLADINPLDHFVEYGFDEGRLYSLRRVLESEISVACAREPCIFIDNAIAANPVLFSKTAIQPCYGLGLSISDQIHLLFCTLKLVLSNARLARLLSSYKALTLWRSENADGMLEINFGLSKYHDREGDLYVILSMDDASIHIISFNISFDISTLGGATKKPGIIIFRSQGYPGSRAAAKAATKLAGGVAPALMLLSALAGFADAMKLDVILGIPAARQISFSEDRRQSMERVYDKIYKDCGFDICGSWFSRELPLWSFPVACARNNHRRRANARRVVKQTVTASARAALENVLAGDTVEAAR